MYYLKNNSKYPLNFEDIYANDYISEEDKDTSKKAVAGLKDFDYSVKGDKSSYKIEYLSTTGEKNSLEGSYENDYH